MSLQDYFRFTLGLGVKNVESIPAVRRVEIPPEKKSDGASTIKDNASVMLDRIVIIITWFMILSALACVITIIYLSVTGKKIPAILPQISLMVLGYFGGLLTSFVRLTMGKP